MVPLCSVELYKARATLDFKSRDSSASRSDDSESLECWICYDNDRTDAGSLIQPCGCKGDVGVVHHDCLQRWLVESSDNPESLKCKVCNQFYEVERGSQFSLAQGFTTKHWIGTAGVVAVMVAAAGGAGLQYRFTLKLGSG